MLPYAGILLWLEKYARKGMLKTSEGDYPPCRLK